jgi:hypothetical protein
MHYGLLIHAGSYGIGARERIAYDNLCYGFNDPNLGIMTGTVEADGTIITRGGSQPDGHTLGMSWWMAPCLPGYGIHMQVEPAPIPGDC